MGDLKPISHKEFNEVIKRKGFKGKNDFKLKELKAKFGFKTMYDKGTLVISSEDMEPATFDFLRKASKAISVSYRALRYAKNKDRILLKNMRRYMR